MTSVTEKQITLTRIQRLIGKLMLKIIQTNFTPGKVQRIIEQEPTEQFYNKAFGKYDAAIEEGINTTTQRQLQFAQMLNLREIGVGITDEEVVKYSTIQGKQDIIDRMNQEQQQQQQMQQAQAQQEMQVQQAQMNLMDANSIAQKGLGIERISRVEENRALAGERQAETLKDQAIAQYQHDKGLLDLTKAIKEIQNVDLSQLQKLIDLANIMDRRDAQAQQQLPRTPEMPTIAEQYAQLAAMQGSQQQIQEEQQRQAVMQQGVAPPQGGPPQGGPEGMM